MRMRDRLRRSPVSACWASGSHRGPLPLTLGFHCACSRPMSHRITAAGATGCFQSSDSLPRGSGPADGGPSTETCATTVLYHVRHIHMDEDAYDRETSPDTAGNSLADRIRFLPRLRSWIFATRFARNTGGQEIGSTVFPLGLLIAPPRPSSRGGTGL